MRDDMELRDNGDIVVDGDVVGYLGWNKNVLVDISVNEEHQEQGVATAAVNLLVERLERAGYDEITTTTVVSGAMETVLARNGFEQVVVEKEPPIPHDVREDVDDLPMVEEVEWRREL